MSKKRNELVAVLKGGLSKEREVSLVTGKACADGLRTAGYRAIEIDFDRNICETLASVNPDICFNALHGPLGEDGCVQGLLNVMGLPYTHSGVAASAIAMNKHLTKKIADGIGIETPCGGLMTREEFFNNIPSMPFVIKPLSDGSSIDTYIVRNWNTPPFEFVDWPYGRVALVEELIQGTELTVTVLEDRPLAVTEIISFAGFYDFSAKYAPGGSHHILPAQVPPAVIDRCKEQAFNIHKEIGCRGISRSDFIFEPSDGRIVFLEINTQPGMTPTSLAPEQADYVGISFPDLMRILAESATID